MKTLTFDIMVGDRFYKTMRLKIGLDFIDGYDENKPIINFEKIEEFVLKKCPTLKYEDWKICF